MIVLILICGLMRDVPEELPLHEFLYLDFELEPSEGVSGGDMVLPPSIVDHQGNDGRLNDNEENDNEKGN